MMKTANSEQQHKIMVSTPIPKLVTTLAIPTMFGQLITVIYNTADTYFVSQINTASSAAVGVVFSLMSIIQAFGYGISMGANSLISRSLGAKRDEEACVYASSSLFIAFVVGILLMIPGLLTLKPLMLLLGSTETILPYAASYAKYILIGAPIMCCSFVLNSILRAEGEALYAMIGLTAGGVLNMALDPLLIFALDMGISGAALATVISQGISFVILAVFFLRGKSIVKLDVRYISRRGTVYYRVFRCGFPTICRQGMGSISSALLNIAARGYGDCAVAAMTIANKVYMLIRNVVLGIGQGFQPVAGYNYGAQKNERVRSAFQFSCLVGSVICVVCTVLIFFFRSPLVGWFRDDAEVIKIGADTLLFLCLSMPFMGYSTYVNQLYQCLGFSGWAAVLACCRQGIFFIPLVLILPRVVGISGIESVQAVADILTFIVSIPFQLVFYKKVLRKDGTTQSNT